MFENREQIEISRYYERLPKPVSVATQEFIDGKLYFRRPSEMNARHNNADNELEQDKKA